MDPNLLVSERVIEEGGGPSRYVCGTDSDLSEVESYRGPMTVNTDRRRGRMFETGIIILG